jgi:DNA-binding NtrC family response regulator
METGSRGVVKKGSVRNKVGKKKGGSVFKRLLVIEGYKLIVATLEKNSFNKSKTADELGIDRNTLNAKIKEYKRMNKSL